MAAPAKCATAGELQGLTAVPQRALFSRAPWFLSKGHADEWLIPSNGDAHGPLLGGHPRRAMYSWTGVLASRFWSLPLKSAGIRFLPDAGELRAGVLAAYRATVHLVQRAPGHSFALYLGRTGPSGASVLLAPRCLGLPSPSFASR